jgi:hypothetical protein
VNVTGSNSVNVFIGLGVPWTIAAFYWRSKGRDPNDPNDEWNLKYADNADVVNGLADDKTVFVVESRDLGFNVLCYSVLSVVGLVLLLQRSKQLGGVLGGPKVPKYFSVVFMVWLWLAFAGATSWASSRCEGGKNGTWCNAPEGEKVGVMSIFVGITVILAIPAYGSCYWYRDQGKSFDDHAHSKYSFIYGQRASTEPARKVARQGSPGERNSATAVADEQSARNEVEAKVEDTKQEESKPEKTYEELCV